MSKTILITGSSSGIGKATAEYFAEKGWQVAATMRNTADGEKIINPGNIKFYELDVTKPETIAKTIEQVINDFGQIDAVVNNAGFAVGGVFETLNDEMISKQFETNVFGLMKVTRAIIPHFRQQKSGTIVQISSMAGRVSFPLCSLYNSSKWAVEGFSESLFHELAPFNIKMKLIEPGFIKTDFYDRSLTTVRDKSLDMYSKFVEKADKACEHGKSGITPDRVAKVVYKAITSSSNKLRYPIGSPSPMLLFLRKILPEFWFLKLMNKAI